MHLDHLLLGMHGISFALQLLSIFGGPVQKGGQTLPLHLCLGCLPLEGCCLILDLTLLLLNLPDGVLCCLCPTSNMSKLAAASLVNLSTQGHASEASAWVRINPSAPTFPQLSDADISALDLR